MQEARPFNSGGKETLKGTEMIKDNFLELKKLDPKGPTSAKREE